MAQRSITYDGVCNAVIGDDLAGNVRIGAIRLLRAAGALDDVFAVHSRLLPKFDTLIDLMRRQVLGHLVKEDPASIVRAHVACE